MISLSECERNLTIEGACRKTFLFQTPFIVAVIITGTDKKGAILCTYKIIIVLPGRLFAIEKIRNVCYIIRKYMKQQECSLWKKTVLPGLIS